MIRKLQRFWRGQYSLPKSFWGFFFGGMVVVGACAGAISGVLMVLLHTEPIGHRVMTSLWIGYPCLMGIGVWRSANAYEAARWRPDFPRGTRSVLWPFMAQGFLCVSLALSVFEVATWHSATMRIGPGDTQVVNIDDLLPKWIEDANVAMEHRDYTQALRLLIPHATQSDVWAQVTLGRLHYNGEGVPQDYTVAAKWYHLASDQGDAEAQFELGKMYVAGRGVARDDVAAFGWFRKAADQGEGRAQHALGLMYVMGQGVLQDYVSAHLWFNLAAVKGDTEAAERRDFVATKMTAAEIAEARKLAREWKPTPDLH
jgi:uncharacterized protein